MILYVYSSIEIATKQNDVRVCVSTETFKPNFDFVLNSVS